VTADQDRSGKTQALTVVLPAYIPVGIREEESVGYLRCALASVLAQTDASWICRVYDNSADKSIVSDIVAQLDDPRFQHRPNPVDVGLLGSMNRGIAEAETSLVGFLHGDDELSSRYAATVKALCGRYPHVAGLLSGADVIDGVGDSIDPLADRIKAVLSPARRHEVVLSGDRAIARIMFAMWAYSPTLVVRPALINRLRFNESNLYAGDTEFIVDLLVSGSQILATPERLYRYRRHGVSGTVLMTQDGTRARLEQEFFTQKAAELRAGGLRWGAHAATLRPFSRAASFGRLGRSAAARSYR